MLCWITCCLVFGHLLSASDAQSRPETPSVKNSISVAEEVEGQVLGTYFCMEGYHLEGEKVLVCNASEPCAASTTQCRLGHCPDPVLENGQFNSSGPVNVNGIVTFRCNDNYVLQGSTWSQCLEDHSWAPPFPTCRSRACSGDLREPDLTSGAAGSPSCGDRCPLAAPQQQCEDPDGGEQSGPSPAHERPLDTPAPAARTGCQSQSLFLAFRETEDLCRATESFMKRVKENGLTMEELKYSLEMKKAELMAKRLA